MAGTDSIKEIKNGTHSEREGVQGPEQDEVSYTNRDQEYPVKNYGVESGNRGGRIQKMRQGYRQDPKFWPSTLQTDEGHNKIVTFVNTFRVQGCH